MTVVTKNVKTRRTIRFNTLDELLDDARQLVSSEVKLHGNWTVAQMLKHLAIAFTGSIDGISFAPPWFVKVMARLFMKRRFIEKSVPAGFTIPDKHRAELVPSESTDAQEALAELEAAVSRLKNESHRVEHPVLGVLTTEEWTQFHLRHAEMHLSFAEAVN